MISQRWIDKRKPYWERLQSLAERTRHRGLAVLTQDELRELGLLYRQTASDLAAVREDVSSRQLSRFLNQLLGQAHNLIYMTRRSRPKGVLHFYAAGFPRIFRATFPYTIAAVTLFLAGAMAGLLLALFDQGFERYVLGGAMVDTIERREMWTHSILSMKPVASSAIMTNNLMVSFSAFAAGITAGVGTVYMMVFNGLLIGVIGAACWRTGLSLQLWSFVAPHGVLELPAIFIAGGAGLMLARGMLFPGTLTRRDSLAQAGGQSVRLLMGAVPLLVIAGVIEGFVSPTLLPPGLKFLLAASLGTLLVFYLAFAGRGESPAG